MSQITQTLHDQLAASLTAAQSSLASATVILDPVPAPAPAPPPPSAPVPVGIPGTWALKFSDEFPGTALDTTKWHVSSPASHGPNGSPSSGAYDPALVSVSGGNLSLGITASTSSCIYTGPTAQGGADGKFAFTYGVAEARIYLPGDVNGGIYNWPAFWTVTTKVGWPTTGEIDIMEGMTGGAAWTLHYQASSTSFGVPGNWTGWHTFAVDWQPGRMDFYYDGKLVGTQTAGVTTALSAQGLVLDLVPRGSWGVWPTQYPSQALVDYVRVWQ